MCVQEDIPLTHEDFLDEGKQQANDTHVANNNNNIAFFPKQVGVG